MSTRSVHALARLALPASLAVAVTLASFASAAFADDPSVTTIDPVSGDVVFASPTTRGVTLDYTCPPGPPAAAPTLTVELSQPVSDADPVVADGLRCTRPPGCDVGRRPRRREGRGEAEAQAEGVPQLQGLDRSSHVRSPATTPIYAKNTGRDGDHDGIACER